MAKPLSKSMMRADSDSRMDEVPVLTKFDLDDGDPVDDEDDEDDEDDPIIDDSGSSDDPLNFTGFNISASQAESAELVELRALRAEIAQLKSAQAPAPRELTAAEFEELSKKDPRAALTLLVGDVMSGMKGGSGSTVEVAAQVTRDMTQKQMVSEFRKLINSKYAPTENTKLRDAAFQLYKQRGFDTSADPAAEYVAFTLAAERYPELVPQQSQRGRASRASDSQPGKGGGRGGSSTLDSDLKRVATRWGVNVNDAKAVKRLTTLRSHYDSRRIDTGRSK